MMIPNLSNEVEKGKHMITHIPRADWRATRLLEKQDEAQHGADLAECEFCKMEINFMFLKSDATVVEWLAEDGGADRSPENLWVTTIVAADVENVCISRTALPTSVVSVGSAPPSKALNLPDPDQPGTSVSLASRKSTVPSSVTRKGRMPAPHRR